MIRSRFSIPSRTTPWLSLALRAVAPAAGAKRAVLLVHGATLPGFLFDPKPPAPSLLAHLAGLGYAAYALDVRGFGDSTRPEAGTPGFDAARPFARATQCVADVADAMRFLREERAHEPVSLMGFSWGTVLAGCFAAAHPGVARSLVLYAPIYAEPNASWMLLLRDPDDPSILSRAYGAYRWTTAQALRDRWDSDIPVADKAAWRSDEVLAAVLEGALGCDPKSGGRSPPAFRSPNGPFADVFEAFSGRPLYDAGKIREPVLIVRGEGDSTATEADARRLHAALGSREKLVRAVPQGSHFAILERSAPVLYQACGEFLRKY